MSVCSPIHYEQVVTGARTYWLGAESRFSRSRSIFLGRFCSFLMRDVLQVCSHSAGHVPQRDGVQGGAEGLVDET